MSDRREIKWVGLTSMTEHQKAELYKILVGQKSIDWGKVNDILGVSGEVNYDVNELITCCGLAYCGYCALIFNPNEQYLYNGGSACKPCYKDAMNYAEIKFAPPPSRFHSMQKYFNPIKQNEEVLKVVSLVIAENEDSNKSFEQLIAQNNFILEMVGCDNNSCTFANKLTSDVPEINYKIKLRVEFDDGVVIFESISENVEQLVIESHGIGYSYVSKEKYQ